MQFVEIKGYHLAVAGLIYAPGVGFVQSVALKSGRERLERVTILQTIESCDAVIRVYDEAGSVIQTHRICLYLRNF